MAGYDQDDYELLPHQELERLRDENSRLRQNPFKDRAEPKDLQGSVDKLTEAINKFIKLLSDTNHEMVKEFKTSSIQENFKMISGQNEKIAEGILTVAQLIQAPSQAQVAVQTEPEPAPVSEQPMAPPMLEPVPQQAPTPQPLPQMAPQLAPQMAPPEPGSMPPPPGPAGNDLNLPPPPKKKGLFR